MAPATEVAVSIPHRKRQSDCPTLFPTDCGDGFCCGPTSTCVESNGGTLCALSGGPLNVPAVHGAKTSLPSESQQDEVTRRFMRVWERVLTVGLAHSPINEHWDFLEHVTSNQHPTINSRGLRRNRKAPTDEFRTSRRGSRRVINRRDHGHPLRHIHPDVVSSEEAATI